MMNNETHQISELMPDDSNFTLEGQFSLNGQFNIDCTHASKFGDLFHTGLELNSDFGHGEVSILGHKNYTAIRETYRYKQGMISTSHLTEPFIALCFQMKGSEQAIQSSTDWQLDICPGEANLMIIPPLNESFELKEELEGTSFMVVLSKNYLHDLSNRFPHVLEPIFDKVSKKRLCLHKEQNMSITPRMHSVIQRIQQPNADFMVGSLFLEAQILDLLSMMFARQTNTSSNGTSLSDADIERIHRVQEILMNRLTDPPTLAELSKSVGTNEYKLKRGFKEVFGTTPYAYHLEHKLELARSYILDTDLTIAEIAYEVGYSDPAHLTNAFRKQYGIPPSNLR
jgi:AraC-like DNA-binding protein